MKKLIERQKVLRFVEAVKKMPPRVSTPAEITQKEAVEIAKPAIRDAIDNKNRTIDEIKDVAKQCGLDSSQVSWNTWQTYLYTASTGGASPPRAGGARKASTVKGTVRGGTAGHKASAQKVGRRKKTAAKR